MSQIPVCKVSHKQCGLVEAFLFRDFMRRKLELAADILGQPKGLILKGQVDEMGQTRYPETLATSCQSTPRKIRGERRLMGRVSDPCDTLRL